MIWQVDDTDPTRPVHLNLGGPYPLRLTITEAMSLLRTAPRLAGRWDMRLDDDGTAFGAFRYTATGVVAVEVWHQSTNYQGAQVWIARGASLPRDVAGATLRGAQDAADAALRAAGWLLEEG